MSATVGTSRAYVRGTVKDAVQGPRPRRVPVSFFGCNKLGEPVCRLPTMASSSAASSSEGEEEVELVEVIKQAKEGPADGSSSDGSSSDADD